MLVDVDVEELCLDGLALVLEPVRVKFRVHLVRPLRFLIFSFQRQIDLEYYGGKTEFSLCSWISLYHTS